MTKPSPNTNRLLDRLILGTILFGIATTPFLFSFSTHELFEFNKMIWVYGLTVILMGLWLVQAILNGKLSLPRTPLDLPLSLFLLSQVLATIFSIHPRTSILGYYTRFNGGLLSTFAYTVWFYAIVTHIKKSQIKLVILTILASSFLAAWFAIPEHFGRSFSCIAAGSGFNTECWSENTNPKYRIFGSFGQPNWLAAYLVLIIPLAIHQLHKYWKKGWSSRLIWLGVLASLVSAELFTKSRSGFLGLLIVVVTYYLYLGLVNIKQLKQKVTIWIPLFILSIGLIFGTPYSPSISSWITSEINQDSTPAVTEVVPSDPGGTESGEIRQIVWHGAVKVWQRYPWFGSGVETFAYSYYKDRPQSHNIVSEWDFLYNKAHNEFLNFLATTGAVGLTTYLLLLASAGWIAIKYSKNSSTGALIAGLAGLSATNFFGFSTVTVSLLMFVWLALLALPHVTSPTKVATKKQPNLKQQLLISLTIVATLFGLSRVAKTWQADRNFTQAIAYFKLQDQQTAIDTLLSAISLSPNEALYYNKLSEEYARLALEAFQAGEDELSQTLVTASITASDITLELNPSHLNFYRSRVRVFATLSQIDEKYLDTVRQTLLTAIDLAPTDPKLLYNLARVELASENTDQALDYYRQILELKPNYTSARLSYAQALEQAGQLDEAGAELEILEPVASDSQTFVELKQKLQPQLSN